jgi:SAM-dependent methyltransferase
MSAPGDSSVTASVGAQADRWRLALESWAIPPEILASASESPFVLPHHFFARRAARSLEAQPSPSFERAWEALDPPGSVLDVGTGAGAACLPLAARATSMTAVDTDAEMLSLLAGSADRLGAEVRQLRGRWPDVAGEVATADVVTCHHVLYNVPDIEPFIVGLTGRARRRVVVEMTAVHPLSFMNPLWERFYGLVRPSAPTAEDMLALLEALGLSPSHEVWSLVGEAEHESFEDRAEVTRRRLCLQPNRAEEVASALRELGEGPDRTGGPRSSRTRLFTIWWSGRA